MRDFSFDASAAPHFSSIARCARVGVALAVGLLLQGCVAPSTQRAEPYDTHEWLQSSANRIANLALRDNLQSIRRVQLSLYRRNPREWRKWASSEDDAVARTWDGVMQMPIPVSRTSRAPVDPATDAPPVAAVAATPPAPVPVVLQALNGATGIDAIRLAFETAPHPYTGDRVAALVVGWASLLRQANGDTWSQTMIDGVNAENSYRAARNVEISLWLIGSKTAPDGQPLLLATEIGERGRNLVVDRELSKVVARLDLMAAQADEKYRRAALDFTQGWVLGSLGPFLQLARP
ncbi:MAG: hypothetical protein ACRYGA_03935 [Janthinobacterium lividum]